jgi:hypothetical protein
VYIRWGKVQYISPKVQKLIDRCQEWPDTKNRMARRQKECLVMLCCGCSTDQIKEALHISKSTVYNHSEQFIPYFSRGKPCGWEMGLVTFQDIRLYDRKKERRQLPAWAEVKRKCDRFYFK